MIFTVLCAMRNCGKGICPTPLSTPSRRNLSRREKVVGRIHSIKLSQIAFQQNPYRNSCPRQRDQNHLRPLLPGRGRCVAVEGYHRSGRAPACCSAGAADSVGQALLRDAAPGTFIVQAAQAPAAVQRIALLGRRHDGTARRRVTPDLTARLLQLPTRPCLRERPGICAAAAQSCRKSIFMRAIWSCAVYRMPGRCLTTKPPSWQDKPLRIPDAAVSANAKWCCPL